MAQVEIDASQFPEQVRRDLLESLRTRKVHHKFHYDSYKQTQKWLALHRAYSPSRTDADCTEVYEQGFQAAARCLERETTVHLVGLGCGGGQKDARMLKLLGQVPRRLFYTPVDVSTPMVLVAGQVAEEIIDERNCLPLVCDLASTKHFGAALAEHRPEGTRLFTCFGMLPNFEPRLLLKQLRFLVQRWDYLLFSANLVPGSDYAAGMQRILPQYDNDLTRDWLITFLLDLGVERTDGEMQFVIEDDPEGLGLQRVAAYFRFSRPREIQMDEERFSFSAGESIRLFFSYRYTADRVRTLLNQHDLQVLEQWVTRSEEEGVFLVRSSFAREAKD